MSRNYRWKIDIKFSNFTSNSTNRITGHRVITALILIT